MKSWIHDISESYIAGHKPVRKDLKENYVSLNEEQRFGLLSENVLNYIDEQLKNAFGFGLGDLTEEYLNVLLEAIEDMAKGGTLGADRKGNPLSPQQIAARKKAISKLVAVVRSGGEKAAKAGRMLASYGLAGKGDRRTDDGADRILKHVGTDIPSDAITGFQSRSREEVPVEDHRDIGISGNPIVTQRDVGSEENPNPIGSIVKAGESVPSIFNSNLAARQRIIQDRIQGRIEGRRRRLQGPEL